VRTKQRIFGKDFILAWIVSMLSGMCMRMLDSNLASYADFAWDSKALGGYLTTVFTVGSVIMAFLSGRLTDTKGRKNCLMMGCIMFGASTFVMVIIQDPAVALCCRLIQGAAKGFIMVAGSVIVADVVPHDRMNYGMGIYGLSQTLSYAFGPMLGLALVGNDNNYLLMFGVCAVFYLAGTVSCTGIDYEKKRRVSGGYEAQKPVTEVHEDDGRYKGIWKLIEKAAVLPSVNFTIFIAGYACVVVFLTIYSQEILKLSGTQISMFYVFAAAAMFVIRFFVAKIADRRGAMILLVPGHLCMIGCVLILAFFAENNYPLFLLSGALFGIGNSAVYPGLNTVAVVDSPEDRGGQANAAFNFMMDIGMFAASGVFGIILENASDVRGGYNEMFMISVVIMLISLVMSIIFFNNRTRAKRNPRFAAHMERVKRGILD
jgi:MFS family permease